MLRYQEAERWQDSRLLILTLQQRSALTVEPVLLSGWTLLYPCNSPVQYCHLFGLFYFSHSF